MSDFDPNDADQMDPRLLAARLRAASNPQPAAPQNDASAITSALQQAQAPAAPTNWVERQAPGPQPTAQPTFQGQPVVALPEWIGAPTSTPVAYDPNAGKPSVQPAQVTNQVKPSSTQVGGGTASGGLPKAVQLLDQADKTRLAAANVAADKEQEAQLTINNAAQAKAQEISDIQSKVALDSKLQAGIQATQQDKDMQEREARMKDFLDFSKAPPTPHIDPEHYTNNQGWGSKVLTTIAMIFVGSKASQWYLNNLHQNIQNDIDAQKAQYQGAQTAHQQRLVALHTAYGAAKEKYTDDRTAGLATQNLLYTQAENEIKAGMAKYGSETAQAQGQLALNDIAAKKADIAQKAEMIGVRDQQVRDARAAAAASAAMKAREDSALATHNTVRVGGKLYHVDEGGDITGLAKGSSGATGPNAGDLNRGLARPEVAAESALKGLDEYDKLSKEAGFNTRLGNNGVTGIFRDTALDTEANHQAELIASAEKGGHVPDPKRVHEIQEQLSSHDPTQRSQHAAALRKLLENMRQANTDTSHRIKVGGGTGYGEGADTSEGS